MKQFIFGVAACLLGAHLHAQEKSAVPPATAVELGPEHFAQLRTQAYVTALGLTEEQAADLHKTFLMGEKDAAELRTACRQAQEKVSEMMQKSDLKAERFLTADQRTKLVQMRKTGEFDPEVLSCTPSGKTTCKGYDAKGCCATKPPKGSKPTRVQVKEGYPEISPTK